MNDPWTDDALTGSFRIWQRKRGHRFSVDDVLTAYRACEAARQNDTPAQDSASKDPLHVDLGCGIGSVLLMVHERLRWRAIGIEAQAISIELARRNVERNRLGSRVTLVEGDFREQEVQDAASLVTGTPPYFPPGSAIPSPDSQRAYARIEYRGGVEAYLQTAARIVSGSGTIVVCGDARRPERVTECADTLSLQIVHQVDAFPREGRACLFSIWTLQPTRTLPVTDWPVEAWTARDRSGARTAQAHALREYFGLAPNLSEHASP